MHLNNLFSGLAAALLLTVPAMADVTYNYTGYDFNTFTGTDFNAGDSVTGSFTLTSALGDNLGGANIALSSVGFSFSDGVDTITNTTPGINDCFCSPTIDIWTNGSGQITNWEISLTAGELGSENITAENYYGGIFAGNVIEDSGFISAGEQASTSGSAGEWNVGSPATVPEPGNVALIGIGMLAMAAVRRKWQRRGA